MSRVTTIAVALALATAVASSPALAKLYKWVDENGNVTYSERKPPDTKAQEIELRGVKPANPDAASELEDLRDRSDASRKDREFARTVAEEQRERDERIKKNCEIARENMRVLENAPRVQATDDKGNPYFLDPSQTESRKAETAQQIQQYCN
ncbi:MAG: DUF4124 domain-containing protein [Ectothiorhodospiraceae bacterium]|nr:DUF4124 domain-containing protein [Chromatiales bacterium]MCP5157132.1 DUF4124 domain-containing protein [Ectothiorhodospiraceae bacterium]